MFVAHSTLHFKKLMCADICREVLGEIIANTWLSHIQHARQWSMPDNGLSTGSTLIKENHAN